MIVVYWLKNKSACYCYIIIKLTKKKQKNKNTLNKNAKKLFWFFFFCKMQMFIWIKSVFINNYNIIYVYFLQRPLFYSTIYLQTKFSTKKNLLYNII